MALPLILASSSPRRRDLLAQAGVEITRILAPEIDETPLARELPVAYALRMAEEKIRKVAAALQEEILVLAADTVVHCGRGILPKAETRAQAEACLRRLSGRRHRVTTGVALMTQGKLRRRSVTSFVRFKRLSAQEIAAYLESGEWQGKAGGYAIQGKAAAFIPFISGSYTNIVGLPLTETLGMLESARQTIDNKG